MMSLQKKSPLKITKNRFKNDIVDVSMAMEQLQISAVCKAVALKTVVKDVTIGPKISQELPTSDDFESRNGDVHNLITSTPHQEKRPICSYTPNKHASEKSKKNLFNVSAIKEDKSTNESLYQTKEIIRKQLLNDLEEKRKAEVYKKMVARLKKVEEEENKIKEHLNRTKESIEEERLARATEEFATIQKLLKEEEEQAKLSLQKLSQSQLSHEKRLLDTNERIKELLRQRQELQEKERQILRERRMCLDGIFEKQKEYRRIYEDIRNVSKNCKDLKEFLEVVSSEEQKLKGLNENFKTIIEKCENRSVSTVDLMDAKHVVEQVKNIHDYFVKSAETINTRIQKAEEEAKAEAEKKEKEKKSKEASNLSALYECVDKESLSRHIQLNNFLENFEKSMEPLLNDEKTKKFRFDCQKAVNVPVNAISHLNSSHLEDKFNRLSQLLHGQNVPVGNTYLSASTHPLGVAFCTNLLAKKFVKQGEHTVSSKPEAAFAIAAVIVALWVEFPDFGHLLMAHFQKECPYLIPAYMPQVEGQSNEDYYRTLGYQYSEDGKVESQDKFLKRMSGIMRLYCAILITTLKRSQANKQHPLGINEAWRWLAAVLNLEPRPDISATLIFDLLDVTGNIFYQTYGSQFQKLLLLLCSNYFPLIEKVTPDGCGGPVCRLKAFLERILIEENLPPPDGVLPLNFW